jgi:hypothetical protein
MNKSPTLLWSVPAATTHVGIVTLLGGVVEVCRHFHAPALGWWCLRAKALVWRESAQWRHRIVVPLLGALCLETRHVGSRGAPLVIVAFQG